jgi:hypothetical protein
MGLFSPSNRRRQIPQRRSRPSLLFFLLIVWAVLKLLSNSAPPSLHPFSHASLPVPPRPVPIYHPPGFENNWLTTPPFYNFPGFRVIGTGTFLDLGDRRTQLPASLLINFFPDALILPSCLTQPPPPAPPPAQPANKPLPVRDDWPGFFGAPWVARVNGTLIALLHVYGPRNTALPVASPQFEIYPSYTAQQTKPAFSTSGQARFIRGSKAVLYRVFLTGPVRCLDLVVKNGENSGTGHLYYMRYHHYYEMDIIFQVQP